MKINLRYRWLKKTFLICGYKNRKPRQSGKPHTIRDNGNQKIVPYFQYIKESFPLLTVIFDASGIKTRWVTICVYVRFYSLPFVLLISLPDNRYNFQEYRLSI